MPMTEALIAIDRFIQYTRLHGPRRGISIHDLFLLQDFAHGDLDYCKNRQANIVAILDKMDQENDNVKLVRKSLSF